MEPLEVLIVEDEALLAMELEGIIEDAGHHVAGWATNAKQAMELMESTTFDVAFVDVHLGEGPSGIDVAEHMREHATSTVVFLTANPKRVPEHFAGALGVIAKPYTVSGLEAALRYITEGVRRPPPVCARPAGFTLSPTYEAAWA